jgi:YhcH/YjgK/YiaL family protein
MIVDNIKNASKYYNLGDKYKKALEYIVACDFSQMDAGRYDIEGDDIFALVQNYTSKNHEDGRMEAHQKYIDIQYVVEGNERIGLTDINDVKISDIYDEEKDVEFYEGEYDSLKAKANTFFIFEPGELHMPGLIDEMADEMKKVVIKIKA